MKKSITISFVLLFVSIATCAQLRVDSAGKVGIMTSSNSTLVHRLTVGDNSYYNSGASIGILSSPVAENNKNNIGVEGAVSANSTYSSDKNYGILGIVNQMNTTHGRNYGVSGMIGPLGNHYGGAGVYGANSTYYYSTPSNIQGEYAGYFDGPVNVANVLTAPSMYTISDSRLSDNIVSLNNRDKSGKETLQNILNMNVVEYNLRSRLNEEIPENHNLEKAEEVRNSYEILKKEEEEMAARHHFGIDAQELQKIYPDLVLEGQDGYLSVNYSEIVPLLIHSIQALKQELDEIKGSNGKARKMAHPSEITPSVANTGNYLYQNSPNPFKEQTNIRFSLADDTHDAAICIFDLSGKMLKKLPISSGDTSVTVNGWELGEGMFVYTLLANGQEIDTKRMILSK